MWAYESVFYQIYPLGLTGAPFENDGVLEHRILKLLDWVPHIKKLGANAVYLCPVFESDTHGYNTRDYTKVDVRLGTDDDLKKVVSEFHKNGIRVVLDGVFNHVGRGFWAFRDVLEKREASQYVNWFARIDFSGNSNYNDGLWYEGWEGNYDLVKLNLWNPDVKNHIFNAVEGWIRDFDIDGIRLDVAYCLERGFLNELRRFCDSKKEEFFLLGEVLHGEYGRMLSEMCIHSLTNYQCYKGLYSAVNSYNLFEIVHSLLRLFGPEDWTVARGTHLLSFLDNHDVTRIASILNDERELQPAYALLFGMPGIPSIYYGSEWGVKGDKKDGDPALRPFIEKPETNELTEYIQKLAEIKKRENALNYGGMRSLFLTNRACVFAREWENERILVAVNIDDKPVMAYFEAGSQWADKLITGQEHDFTGGSELAPFGTYFWKIKSK
ncbi:MAG: cyclomaltodextrinase [Lachnospiraceae bacterium]|nr:cyclomaltodextrinase [Lachnospiraceae bacterium]